MWKLPACALVLVCLLPDDVQALTMKNVRATYGSAGATRKSNKFLPGDVVFVEFDIDGITADPKTNMVRYSIKMEVWEEKKKEQVLRREPPA